MADPAIDLSKHFTYGDYRRWPEGERWELIGGTAYNMSPAPTTWHQELSARFLLELRLFLKGKPCKAYAAPFDVLLPERGEDEDDLVSNVVQPDLVVFCDRDKITKAGARGAPDLAVEIISPYTTKKDQREKFDLYERHGVREYWVVDPAGRWLRVYRLKDGRFDEGELREPLNEYGRIASVVLEGFGLEPVELFAED